MLYHGTFSKGGSSIEWAWQIMCMSKAISLRTLTPLLVENQAFFSPHIPPHQSSKLAMVCVMCRYCQGSGEATYLFHLSLSPQKTSKVRSISLVPKPRPLPPQRRGLETRLMQHNIVCCNVKFKPLKNSVADSLWLERLTRVKFCLANTLVSMQVRKVF